MYAGYTRIVSWKRAISVLVLAVLTGLPVSGTTCALICEPGSGRTSRPPGHHDSDAACATAESSAAILVIASARHDCRSHSAVVSPPAILIVRVAASAPPIVAAAPLLPPVPMHDQSASRLDDRAPPILSPPGATLPVLRI
jgi:hypothetical protein